MTDLLDSYRPSTVSDAAPSAEDPTSGEQLTLSVLTETNDPMDGLLVLSVTKNGATWQQAAPMAEFDRVLTDLENGLVSQIELGGEVVTFAADAESVDVPIGPLLATGSLDEWRLVLEREYLEAEVVGRVSFTQTGAAWTGDRTIFSIASSE